MVVRIISVFVFAAGGGALVAGIVTKFLAISVNVAWAASLLGFGLTLAFVFLSASTGAFLLILAADANKTISRRARRARREGLRNDVPPNAGLSAGVSSAD